MIEWKTETRKIKSLKPHPKNPRILTKDQHSHLKTSLEKFGIADKPIINVDGTIIGGHQRLKILKELGHKEIEVLVPNRELSNEEVDEFCIRLNKNTGEWDFDILANEWEVNDLIDWGFTEQDLTGLIDAQEKEEGTEDESEQLEPVTDENAKTKLGDLYELNQHRILCGDSTNSEYVHLCLGDNKPILMVTDPPYGVNYDPAWRKKFNSKTSKTSKTKTDYMPKEQDNEGGWFKTWENFPGDICYIWHSHTHAKEIEDNLNEIGFECLYQIIWSKDVGMSRGDYNQRHEPCFYAIRKGCNHNWQGSKKESTVWDIPAIHSFSSEERGVDQTKHACQKPIECMARPIRNNSTIGEGVYDPFLGSGTTLIAAEQLGRTCYGIELSPGYCDIIVDRWVNFMKKNNKEFVVKKNGEIIDG